MAEDGEDLFGRILKCCKVSESQEAKLLNCPFARDSENVTDSIPLTQLTQSEADHLVIVTPSESQPILEEDSVFHTPPEHHSRSHLSSSEDQNPNADDRRNEQESRRVRTVPGEEYDRALEAGGMDNEPESKRIRAGSKLGETEVVVIEEDDEVIDLSDSELGEIGVPCDSSRSLKGKAVEECAEMHGDDGGGCKARKRRLPPSMDVVEEEEDVGLFGMVDKLRAIFGFPGAGQHVDFLETAKKNGMVFPKPRWQQES